MHFSTALAVLVLLASYCEVAAQPTNAEVLGGLAADCLTEVPPETFVLEAPALAPYARAALIARWQTAGRRVFADTVRAYPRLRLDTAQPAILYARQGRRRYRRHVTLALPYTLMSAEGEVLRADVCRGNVQDVVDRSALVWLEDPFYPETVGARPATGWVRRYAEPLLLGGVAAASTLLFFSLRSR